MPVPLTASRAPRGFAPSRRGFIVVYAGFATAIGLTARRRAVDRDPTTTRWRLVCFHRTRPP
jgi:hypothetical protein